jgi:hypothetical protein
MAGLGLYRADQVLFSIAEEDVDGTRPTTINGIPGIIKSGIQLPTPDYAWDPFFGVGRDGRNRRDIHEGLQTFRASIPQIWVLHEGSREILEMCLGEHSDARVALTGTNPGVITAVAAGTMNDSGEDFSVGDLNVKEGSYAVFSGTSVGYISSEAGAGINQVVVYPTPNREAGGATAGWNGPQPAVDDNYEIRKTESVGTAAGNKFTVPTQRLNTMAWAAQFRNSTNHGGTSVGSNLTTNYLGGKVNRFTLSASQGEKLSLALDEVIFRELVHDSNLPVGVAKNGPTTAPTGTFPTEQPLIFSQGTINLFELNTSFAKINSFRLTVDNQLTEARYLSTTTINGNTVITQIPNEIIEGQRRITLEVEAVMETLEYWEHLMRQGQNDALSAKTGFDFRLQFRVDSAAAESFYIQGPGNIDLTLVRKTGASDIGSPIESTTAQSLDTNVGAVITRAPHDVPTGEAENLVTVPITMDIPHYILWWTDA